CVLLSSVVGCVDSGPDNSEALSQTSAVVGDNDNDGIPDELDLDDDNDGIPDLVELGCAQATATNETIVTTVGLQSVSGLFESPGGKASYAVDLSDASIALVDTRQFDGEGVSYSWDDRTLAFTSTVTIAPDAASWLNGVKWGADLMNINNAFYDNNSQTITLSWTGAGSAIVHDPNGQLSNADGATLNSGDSIALLADQLNGTGTWYIEFPMDLSGDPFVLTLAHSDTANFIYEGYSFTAEVCGDSDIDGDGISPAFDPDSDGDGCFDAIEGGAGLTSGAVDTNGQLTGLLDGDGIPQSAEGGQTTGDSLDAATLDLDCPRVDPNKYTRNCDFDGDGYKNGVDWDDDNDGILDDDESVCPPSPAVTIRNMIGPTYFSSVTTNAAGASNLDDVIDGDAANGGVTYPLMGGPTFSVPVTIDITNNFGILASGLYIANDIGVVGDGAKDVEVTLFDGEGNVLGVEPLTISPSDFTGRKLFSKAYDGVRSFRLTTYTAYTGGGGGTDLQFRELGLYGEYATYCDEKDSDGDMILDRFDPDSDDDGCNDAVEGAGPYTDLNTDGNGMFLGGVDGNGVPTDAMGGQAVGVSDDELSRDPDCTDCGNSIVEGSEACDDGDTDDTNACNNSCFINTGFGTCTVDLNCANADAACVGGLCVLQQGEGVCAADGDCEGALTCNAGVCEAAIATGATGCDTANTYCVNADAACVADTCVLQQGEGVCAADGDCEGALTCNAGVCEAAIATGATGCSVANTYCVNTDAACVGDTCVLQQGEGVCVADGDCEGALTCNAGLCEAGIATGATGCSAANTYCVNADAACVGDTCVLQQGEGVCVADGDCEGALTCEAGVCEAAIATGSTGCAAPSSYCLDSNATCVGDTCVLGLGEAGCFDDNGCAGSIGCNSQGICGADDAVCADNADCVNTCIGGTCAPIASNGEVCDTDDDADCESGLCVDSACETCVDDAIAPVTDTGCDANDPICDTSGGVGTLSCVQCLSSIDCAVDEVCSPQKQCALGCLDDNDCGGSEPLCQLSAGTPGFCVECLGDADCPGMQICGDSNTCGFADTDMDGIPDDIDQDDDGDGILDIVEGGGIDYSVDSDMDGVPDAWDPDVVVCDDADMNGICDALPAELDADGDGIPNYLDLDSDGDGIDDAIEGNDANGDGIADVLPVGNDHDGDGIDDAFDEDCAGMPTGCLADGVAASTPDADEDGFPDYLDVDSDGCVSDTCVLQQGEGGCAADGECEGTLTCEAGVCEAPIANGQPGCTTNAYCTDANASCVMDVCVLQEGESVAADVESGSLTCNAGVCENGIATGATGCSAANSYCLNSDAACIGDTCLLQQGEGVCAADGDCRR
ncbi:MAG: hypothetical protein R3A47_05430, partial [Polyangiales bacterium]